jgi:hypothetical protein
VGGIPIPNAGGIYQYKLAAIPPGGRLSSDMAPVIVTRHTPVLAVATVGTSLVQETVRVVASSQGRTVENLRNILAGPPLLLNIEATKDPLAPRQVPVPQNGYDETFLAELDNAGIPIVRLPAERVLALKGTAATGLIGAATGSLQGAEVPGVSVFVETY